MKGIIVGTPQCSFLDAHSMIVGGLGAPLHAFVSFADDRAIEPTHWSLRVPRFLVPAEFVYFNSIRRLRLFLRDGDPNVDDSKHLVILVNDDTSELIRAGITVYPKSHVYVDDLVWWTTVSDPLSLVKAPEVDVLSLGLSFTQKESVLSRVNPLFYRVPTADRERARKDFVRYMFGGRMPSGIPVQMVEVLSSEECQTLRGYAQMLKTADLDTVIDAHPEANEFDLRYLLAKRSSL